MLYEILNPSDAYTLESDDFAAACLAICILSEGMYGLKEIDGDREMPLMLSSDAADAWANKEFGKPFSEFAQDVEKEKVVAALDSILVGSKRDREMYSTGMSLIDNSEKKKQFHDEYVDKHRTSMNDIGQRAKALVEVNRDK